MSGSLHSGCRGSIHSITDSSTQTHVRAVRAAPAPRRRPHPGVAGRASREAPVSSLWLLLRAEPHARATRRHLEGLRGAQRRGEHGHVAVGHERLGEGARARARAVSSAAHGSWPMGMGMRMGTGMGSSMGKAMDSVNAPCACVLGTP